ncbi:MAG TPA: lytic transglycosylase domain-containing protein [Longimicrobiales bacterium]|nr:lytic transglycosylase domain-containing protein [Longimicrobiales bacterium]
MRKWSDRSVLGARLRRAGGRRAVVGMTLLLPAALWLATAPQPLNRAAAIAAEQEARGTEDAVARAWAVRELEQQRSATIETLAAEFTVDLPLAENIHDAALSERIDPRLAFGLVRAESSFRPKAVSPVGAIGLTQVMPATARWLEPGTTRRDLMDPDVNLRLGFKYLRQLLDQYDEDPKLALTAYNRGPGTVNRLLRRGSDPDNGYADKVLTGKSDRHVRLMNAKFLNSRSSKPKARGRG